jgi:hypothetical protein
MGAQTTGSQPMGVPRNRALESRVDALRARVLGSARARRSFGVEGVLCDDGATVIFHGAIGPETVTHLTAVLEGLTRLRPSRLTVDLTAATVVSSQALATVARFESEVDQLTVRLPDIETSTPRYRQNRVALNA